MSKYVKISFLTATSLILSFGSPLISLSATPTNCDQYEEIFGFQMPTYATQHQGGAILNIKVAYRYMPDAIANNDYPDFVPIKKEIDKFFLSYANKTDFWEIVNKKLVQFILDKYPQLSSLMVEIDVDPTPKETSHRFSKIRRTRPQACSMTFP
jgi:hypothetical protein